MYVDTLTKDNDGVKYKPIRENLLDRAADAKGKQTIDSKDTFREFLSLITKHLDPKKICQRGNRTC